MKRLECLDGLRGVLAVYVMLGHMAPFALLPEWVQGPLSHGGAAVDMFFVLSGLVIARSLDSAGYRAAPFLVSRIARTFPAFLIVFAAAVAVQAIPAGFPVMPWLAAGSPGHAIWSFGWPRAWIAEIAAHLTMTHGLFPDSVLPGVWVSFLGAAWSLSTEWQFYVLALVVGRAARGQRGATIAVLLLMAFAGEAWDGLAPEGWRFSRAFLGNKAAWFALGIASAALVLDGRRSRDEPGEQGAERRYLLVLCVALFLALWDGPPGKALVPLGWTVCLAAQPGVRFGLFLVPGAALGWVASLLAHPVMQWFGAISYSLYLVNEPVVNEPVQKVLGLAVARIADGNGVLFTLIWLPTATILPVVCAARLRRHVELPGIDAGRRYSSAPRYAMPRVDA
jgi:peptidoglycan/LPS O-acetylase OafA/YrhL